VRGAKSSCMVLEGGFRCRGSYVRCNRGSSLVVFFLREGAGLASIL